MHINKFLMRGNTVTHINKFLMRGNVLSLSSVAPYGIRESTSRVGKDKAESEPSEKKKRRAKKDNGRTESLNGDHLSEAKNGKVCVDSSDESAEGASMSSSVSIERKDNTLEDGSAGPHYPSKVQYGLYQVFKDLLNFAASSLVIGGKLVFFLPVIRYGACICFNHRILYKYTRMNFYTN